jgi:hypothetical protein
MGCDVIGSKGNGCPYPTKVQIQHNPSARNQLDLGLSQIHSQVELAFVFDMTFT